MSATPVAAPVRPPKAWQYIALSLMALLILIPLWMMFVSLVLQPEYTVNPEVSMTNRLMWWLIAPVTAVALFAGWRWQVASTQAKAAQEAPALQVEPATPAASTPVDEVARREYVLEVIGLGVTLDKYRQGKLWEVLQKGHAFGSIREQDPMKYPWSADEKEEHEGGRIGSTAENGLGKLPLYWPSPSFYAGSSADDVNDPSTEAMPAEGIVGGAESDGLGWTLFVSAGFELSEHPDRLLERAFAFFDAHPDVPYLVIAAADGLYQRNLYRLKGSPPLIKDGHYIPSMPDSSALFVLARRERVEAIRPFAVEDVIEHTIEDIEELNRRGLARRIGVTYLGLMRAAQPRSKDAVHRNLTVPEWLAESAKLAKNPDFYPDRTISFYADRLNPFGGGVVRAPEGFKPTPWFPVPWTKEQLAEFDALPTLGYLHRPTYIKLTDQDGRVLKRRDERTKALIQGWQQALLTLPEAQRKAAPTRIVASTGGDTDKMITLTSLINTQAEAGGPELDAAKPSQWVNTDARLGNTGAATWFVQMGIGVLASHIDGGVSAAINLRNDQEASVIFISPPPEDKRIKQNKANVFKNNTTPAIDPANYSNN
ncbi:MAG: DUF2875 domain-containing protein [Aquabacterium sp.]|nr:MAG: DUF2875 domain-containing protein [Aquabacterium sp.]